MKPYVHLSDLSRQLVATIFACALEDEQWRAFGFRKCPKRGRKFDFLVSAERLAYEQFLLKEFITLGVSTIIDAYQDKLPRKDQEAFLRQVLETIKSVPMIHDVLGERSPSWAAYSIGHGAAYYVEIPSCIWPELLIKRAPALKNLAFHEGLLGGSRGLPVRKGSILNRVREAAMDLFERERDVLTSAEIARPVNEQEPDHSQQLIGIACNRVDKIAPQRRFTPSDSGRPPDISHREDDLSPQKHRDSPCILVVDDEVAIRKMYHECLLDVNYKTEEAGDGLEAIQQLKAHHFDLVITNICMPEINGIELLAHMKKHYPAIKTIVVTGMGDDKTRAEAFALGAVDFFSKPFAWDDLLDAIRRHVSGSNGSGETSAQKCSDSATRLGMLEQRAESLVSAARIAGAMSYTKVYDMFPAFRTVSVPDWDLYFPIAAVYIATEGMNRANLSEQEKRKLSAIYGQALKEWQPKWHTAFTDCGTSVNRFMEAIADSQEPEHIQLPRSAFFDAMGSWLVSKLLGRIPENLDEIRLARAVGTLTCNEFMEWWKVR